MGSTHRAILEGLSRPILVDAIFEMASRTASMVRYLREFGDHRRSREVKVALLKEQEKRTIALHEDLWATREKIVELNASIVNEHEEGFYKALRQAVVLLHVHEPFDVGFDIEKDVYDGELVYLGPPNADENPAGPDPVDPGVDTTGSSNVAGEDNADR